MEMCGDKNRGINDVIYVQDSLPNSTARLGDPSGIDMVDCLAHPTTDEHGPTK